LKFSVGKKCFDKLSNKDGTKYAKLKAGSPSFFFFKEAFAVVTFQLQVCLALGSSYASLIFICFALNSVEAREVRNTGEPSILVS